MTPEIECDFNPKNGFFLDDTIKYSADVRNFIKGFSDKFSGLLILRAEFKELSYNSIGYNKTTPITFSEDNTRLDLKLTFHKSYDRNGRAISVPTVFEFYDHLRFMLEKAAKEYENIKL